MQIEEAPPAATTREESLLTAMSNLPGVTGVSTTVVGNGNHPNDHGVRWKLNGKPERCACTIATGTRPTLLHAIEGALDKLRKKLGADVVNEAVAAVETVAATGYTTEEMEWLTDWYEKQEEPEHATPQIAHDALRQHRMTAGSASAAAMMQEAQLLLAQQRAAERGVEKAQASLAKARAELARASEAIAQPAKKQRVEPPEWQSREYSEWSTVEYWRQEEGRAYNRRRVVWLSSPSQPWCCWLSAALHPPEERRSLLALLESCREGREGATKPPILRLSTTGHERPDVRGVDAA